VIPSEEEAIALHRKYGSSEIIIRHCETVSRVAEALGVGIRSHGKEIDLRVVKAAALLHDIGRNRTQTVSHGMEGAEILSREGVDNRVVQAVRCHVGAGLSSEEAKTMGLPAQDYIPRTLEERVVCFADKMVGSDQVRTFQEEVTRFVRKKHDVNRLLELKSDLGRELGKDPEEYVLDNVKESQ
jgi:uncharacterized protein (TIGR00295 family)